MTKREKSKLEQTQLSNARLCDIIAQETAALRDLKSYKDKDLVEVLKDIYNGKTAMTPHKELVKRCCLLVASEITYQRNNLIIEQLLDKQGKKKDDEE